MWSPAHVWVVSFLIAAAAEALPGASPERPPCAFEECGPEEEGNFLQLGVTKEKLSSGGPQHPAVPKVAIPSAAKVIKGLRDGLASARSAPEPANPQAAATEALPMTTSESGSHMVPHLLAARGAWPVAAAASALLGVMGILLPWVLFHGEASCESAPHFSGLSLAVDSLAAVAILPMLPLYEASGSRFSLPSSWSTAELFLIKPAVATLACFLLPSLCQRDPLRGRVVMVFGLATLTASCLGFTVSASFEATLAASVASALGGASVLAAAIHSAVLDAPRHVFGAELGLALSGLAIGSAAGPWVGGGLGACLGMQGAMAAVGAVAAGLGCMGLLIPALRAAGNGFFDHQHARNGITSALQCVPQQRAEHSPNFSLPTAFQYGPQQRVLLTGLVLASAVRSLHGTLLPFAVSRAHIEGFSLERLSALASLASLVLGAATFTGGGVADRVGSSSEHAISLRLLAALLSAVGLCTVVHASEMVSAATGVVVSQFGIGAYLGLSMPLIVALCSGKGGEPADAAAAAGTTAAALMLGDFLGVAAQVMLVPYLGATTTVLAFAAALVLQAGILAALGDSPVRTSFVRMACGGCGFSTPAPENKPKNCDRRQWDALVHGWGCEGPGGEVGECGPGGELQVPRAVKEMK